MLFVAVQTASLLLSDVGAVIVADGSVANKNGFIDVTNFVNSGHEIGKANNGPTQTEIVSGHVSGHTCDRQAGMEWCEFKHSCVDVKDMGSDLDFEKLCDAPAPASSSSHNSNNPNKGHSHKNTNPPKTLEENKKTEIAGHDKQNKKSGSYNKEHRVSGTLIVNPEGEKKSGSNEEEEHDKTGEGHEQEHEEDESEDTPHQEEDKDKPEKKDADADAGDEDDDEDGSGSASKNQEEDEEEDKETTETIQIIANGTEPADIVDDIACPSHMVPTKDGCQPLPPFVGHAAFLGIGMGSPEERRHALFFGGLATLFTIFAIMLYVNSKRRSSEGNQQSLSAEFDAWKKSKANMSGTVSNEGFYEPFQPNSVHPRSCIAVDEKLPSSTIYQLDEEASV